MAIQPGERAFFQDQFFTENGSSFAYEHLPHAPEGGLLEGTTPECSGPAELLLYQRAQEELIQECLPEVTAELRRLGYAGQIGLIKNCRDALGNVYGAQENYQLPVAQGWRRLVWVTLTALYLPFFAVGFLLYWPLMLVVLGLGSAARALLGLFLGWPFDAATVLGRLEYYLAVPYYSFCLAPLALLYRWLAFHSVRGPLVAFLVSRPLLSGAGTLLEDGSFRLCEKGVAVRRLFRLSIAPSDRPFFDTGNLLKGVLLALFQLFRLQTGHLRGLFAREQRLQLGISDSNRADQAEFLKIGTTKLVLEMALAGVLSDAPVLRQPLRDLQNLTGPDSALRARRGAWTALSVQEYFLERAEQHFKDQVTLSLETREILQLWRSTLEALRSDSGRLLGRLDWVTKKYLLATAGKGASPAMARKLDIAYHELGSGYFDRLAEAGVTATLLDAQSVRAARHQAPGNIRARLRSQYIKEASYRGDRIVVSWNQVSGRMGVVSLDDFRRQKKSSAGDSGGG